MYAIILAIHLLQIIIVIAAFFNFKSKLYNTVDTFVNILLDKLIYI